MGFTILQWNSRSLFKNGVNSNYFSTLDDLPDDLCIRESHLTPEYQPSIPHYHVICKDRPPSKGKDGSLMICVKTSLDFSKFDLTLPGNSNPDVLGISVHGLSIFNI